MKRLQRYVARFLKYGTLLSSAGLMGATLIQIYARFYMDNAPSWTEEAARFFFVYAMAFGAGLAMKNDLYVQFDVFFNRLKPRWQRSIKMSITFFTLILFIVLAFYGIQLVRLGIVEHSPSLGVPMAIAFASMVVMGLSVAFFAFLDLIKTLKKWKN